MPEPEPEEEAAEEEAAEEEAAEEEGEDEESDDDSDDDQEMDAALAKLTGGDSEAPSEGDASEARTCTICNAEVEAGMTQCPVCSFTF